MANANELRIPVVRQILCTPESVRGFKNVIGVSAKKYGATFCRIENVDGDEIVVIGFPVSAEGAKALADYQAYLEREAGIVICGRSDPRLTQLTQENRRQGIVDSLRRVASKVCVDRAKGELAIQCDHLVKGMSVHGISEVELPSEIAEKFKSHIMTRPGSTDASYEWIGKLYLCPTCTQKAEQILRTVGFWEQGVEN